MKDCVKMIVLKFTKCLFEIIDQWGKISLYCSRIATLGKSDRLCFSISITFVQCQRSLSITINIPHPLLSLYLQWYMLSYAIRSCLCGYGVYISDYT